MNKLINREADYAKLCKCSITFAFTIILFVLVIPIFGDDKTIHEQTSVKDKAIADNRYVIASCGDYKLTANEFNAVLQILRPQHPRNYYTKEQLDKLARSILVTRALSKYAYHLKIHQKPVVQYRIDSILRDELINTRVDKEIRLSDITDDHVAAFYKNNEKQFVIPETILVHHIFIAKQTGSGEQNEKINLAREILKKAKSGNQTLREFQKLVRLYSEDRRSRVKGGLLGFFQGDDLDGKPLDVNQQILRKESAKLKTIGEITGPIETKEGFHVIRLSGKRPEHILTIDQVREEIRYKLYKKSREAALNILKDSVIQRSSIQVDTNSLEHFIAQRTSAESPVRGHPPVPPIPSIPKSFEVPLRQKIKAIGGDVRNKTSENLD
jgi:peptidyl-prolyl cis-trans isomerase C